nr:molybdate ABC transporter permease subunit [Phaeovibrio sulfidiphilus]
MAMISTGLMLVLFTPLAWGLARMRSSSKAVFEAIVALPLVLPPTVLGFYLLIALGPRGVVGGALESLGFGHLAFSFSGLVIGSMIYSLPFVMQPLQNAFQALDPRLMEAAATLRASPLDRFFTIAVPLASRGFLSAAVLSFAHTMGEFGVVIMIGGSIPGETRVASIAIFNHVETMDYAAAHGLAGVLLVISFLLLLGVFAVNRRFARITGPGA